MRSIALDVHRDFCEVAIKDESGLRLAGRVKSSVCELELFARSLAPDDEVALEATGGALQIARILEGHVARVVVANTRKLSAIAQSKVKTDKLDARTLCELLAAGFLPAVFSPDEFTRPAPTAAAPFKARALAHARQERVPRGAGTQPQGPPADDRRLRQARTRVAGRARASGRRARDGRVLPQGGRLPRQRGRLDRARAGPPGDVLSGDPPPDDRSRRVARLGGDVRGGRRRHQSLQLAEAARLLCGFGPA